MDQTFEIKEKLAHLEQALLDNTPTMPTLLRSIHTMLKKDDELVTLLSEEECAVLVQGLSKQTKTEVATKSLKKSNKKAMNKTTVADL